MTVGGAQMPRAACQHWSAGSLFIRHSRRSIEMAGRVEPAFSVEAFFDLSDNVFVVEKFS